MTPKEYTNDPFIQGKRQEFMKKYGESVGSAYRRREINAERNAIPTIRQILGSNITRQSQTAMKVVESTPH